MKLSVVYIVKNEEVMLRDSLESVKGADEIIVFDTGSTDNTLKIAKEYTDKVYNEYKWNDNFAEARNLACDKATGDWILSMDADWTLEPGGIEKIKNLIEQSKEESYMLLLDSGSSTHYLKVLFKNKYRYVGEVHEVVMAPGNVKYDIKIHYKSSPSRDPKRNLRILEKAEKTPRNLFYLAKEYMDNKIYDKAIATFYQYLAQATWYSEIAEAYLCLAKCFWYTNHGDKARYVCIQAIRWNPEFKEAYLWMAKLHYSPYKEKWLQLAELATNQGVLFVRT